MRLAALIACFLFAGPAAAAREPLPTLTPAQAISRASAASPAPVRAIFQLKVQSAARSRTGFYLNSEPDFRSPSNVGIAIRASAMPGLARKYGRDLKAAFSGRTIKVIGQVRRVAVGKSRTAAATQVEVTRAGQILAVD